VVARCGSVPEIITPGRTGFLADTLDEIVEALREPRHGRAAHLRRPCPGEHDYRVCPTAVVPRSANRTLSCRMAGWHL
jgi:hypothetical protein